MKVRYGAVASKDGLWPILLKNSISADGPKILALTQREARVDVGDHKQSLISHPKAS